jgi:hypothetical protein
MVFQGLGDLVLLDINKMSDEEFNLLKHDSIVITIEYFFQVMSRGINYDFHVKIIRVITIKLAMVLDNYCSQ